MSLPALSYTADQFFAMFARANHAVWPVLIVWYIAAIAAIEALRVDNDAISREARFALQHMRLNRMKLDTAFVRVNVEEARPHYPACLAHAPDVGPIPT